MAEREPTREPSSLPRLGWDILATLISGLPLETLKTLRLVNKALNSLATREVFRHVRLSAATDGKGFVNIARSDRLRPYVREVTCDTDVGNYHAYDLYNSSSFTFPWQFYAALPFVRYFGSLRAVHLRFNQYCESGTTGGNAVWAVDVAESPDIRFRILHTIFCCLEGTWTAEQQSAVDMELDLKDETDSDEDDDDEDEKDEKEEENKDRGGEKKRAFYADGYRGCSAPTHPRLSQVTLTVGNLADYDDARLTSSDTFRSVLGTQITALKLLLANQEDEASPEAAVHFPDKYDLAEKMPRTWLMPSLARHLRVLSLYSSEYWGWLPRMDFRWINPGSGPDAGFPHLRVLALGNYVFSHEWQADWMASLGKQNGKGGLEELYLDDCPILYGARAPGPLDSGTAEITNALTAETVAVSNDLYPLRSTMLRRHGYPTVDVAFPLRWSHILDRWTDLMGGLKVFRTGHGCWDDRDSIHVSYDCPSFVSDDDDDAMKQEKGISVSRRFQCQYIYFNINVGPSPWLERDEGRRAGATGPDPACTDEEKDGEALEKLLKVVEQRTQSSAARL